MRDAAADAAEQKTVRGIRNAMDRQEVEDMFARMLSDYHDSKIPLWKDWKVVMGLPAAILASIALWVALGFPTFATSAELKRIERTQAEIAVQTYQNTVNNLIATTPPDNAPPAQKHAWQQQYEQATRQLNRAIDQKIELSK